MTINIDADILDFIGTIISSITLLLVVWASITTQKQFRNAQRNLSSYSGTEIFKTNLEISKLLICKDTFTDKMKIFKSLYASKEEIKNKKFKEEDIELNAFILLNLSFYEYIYGAHKFQVLEDKEFEGWVHHMKFFFSKRKVMHLWKEFKYGFQPDFINWIDEEIIETK